MKSTQLILLSVLAAILGLSQANAQTLTVSSTEPTPGANDVYNLPSPSGTATEAVFGTDYSTSPGSGYYSNGATTIGGDYGLSNEGYSSAAQTFTTGSNATGYEMTSLTVQVALNSGSDAISWDPSDQVYIGSVSSGGQFTLLNSALVSWGSTTGTYGDYITYTPSAPLALAANTEYAYVYGETYQGPGYVPLALDSSASYAGGTASAFDYTQYLANSNTTLSAFTGAGSSAMDAIFDVGLTANATVPEPSAWAMMVIGLGSLMAYGLRKKLFLGFNS
jgi:hypothetical protein